MGSSPPSGTSSGSRLGRWPGNGAWSGDPWSGDAWSYDISPDDSWDDDDDPWGEDVGSAEVERTSASARPGATPHARMPS